ncbi:hypothetical protein G647_03674 [Cladophialophora carrionii CBS 160.54]|uniref:Uncharacterized protein n=1 Tax=Cladophialophora carrionii CBS 160.54 TaxID=1279043 RepID=V9DBT5_9EURO|nr:uncharacterized protein G647_03674 [Cladophialophora carrionii CBS 160.54]ETI24305.1 hypothetical protein G647_03674 [Cladophialophora carrionii CBS 160.54]
MSTEVTEDEVLFNSTASTTEPPRAYFSVSRPDSVLTIIDNPFRTRQSTVLVIIGVVALGICTVFLAVRYAQVLRCNMHECVKAPLTLEAQKSNRLGDDDQNEDYPDDQTPVTQSPDSYDDNHSSIRRRPRARFPQPKTIAIGGVREGKIAQRRASMSRSVGRDVQAPKETLAMTEPI